ncbi:hypothetical protein D5041_21350 (plasmid) [Verminephrobacter aporrectodeae subsp. tuberculatae]|uniref:hypothetical protein n=1 Tax=Verminephrobacter aporrectodeae TaxID=1110389 RepID=UPI002238A3FB|nr:hypothetical protein [Verminephrobacter aporrectodeae]MCW5223633.1 hypothetical protein [Verminephrobacter aporrectodeae subsp. tuberculatae]MCW5291473.1 hypothetical protein [Verminephrobacter aporrectodeae subsp. tuberculatae]
MKPPQSLAGYIRQHLTELEERLEVGIRQEVIVSELATYGYKTTLKGFRNFLYRARIRAAQKSVAVPAKNQSQKEQRNAPFVASGPDHQKQKSPPNPLTKKSGFDFKGTNSVDENDLI